MTSLHHVLIIDDDDDVGEAIADVLQDAGYSVTRACNGKVALELLAETEPPALILLDLMMPVMDGDHFRQAQLQNPRLADISVVILSADHLIAQKAAHLHVRGHLLKPFDPDQLLRVVRENLHGTTR